MKSLITQPQDAPCFAKVFEKLYSSSFQFYAEVAVNVRKGKFSVRVFTE